MSPVAPTTWRKNAGRDPKWLSLLDPGNIANNVFAITNVSATAIIAAPRTGTHSGTGTPAKARPRHNAPSTASSMAIERNVMALPHAAFERDADESLGFRHKLHRQLLDHLARKPVDDQRNRFLFIQAAREAVEHLVI